VTLALLLLHLCSAALAVTPEQVEARLSEVQAYRALRVVKGAPVPQSADVRKAAGGTPVTGLLEGATGTASRVYANALVNLGIAPLWAALNDETRHPGYTAVTYSELVSGQVCRSGRRVLQYVPVPMLSDRWWIGVLTVNQELLRQSGGAVRELAWSSSVDAAEITSPAGQKMIAQASPIAFTRGGWFLVAVDERNTFVEYFANSDPGGRIPSSLASMAATRGVRDNIDAIVRFAKEGKPSCPIQ
jgi:hypothetical protein